MSNTISKVSNSIKNRKTANDVFITPQEVAKMHINMIDEKYRDAVWFDPFRNTGSYYNNFPSTCEKKWTEILDGEDFFHFNEKVDVICSNPPFSILNDVIKKCIELNPSVIALLVGQLNLIPNRIHLLEQNGYVLTKLHITRIKNWFGNSYLVVWEKTDAKPLITYCLEGHK